MYCTSIHSIIAWKTLGVVRSFSYIDRNIWSSGRPFIPCLEGRYTSLGLLLANNSRGIGRTRWRVWYPVFVGKIARSVDSVN